jgi:hypothetical protein
VRWCIPRGLFGKGCSSSGLPPSRILIFRDPVCNAWLKIAEKDAETIKNLLRADPCSPYYSGHVCR